MSIFEATIQGVTQKTVNRKRDGQPFTLYEIQDHTGLKWSTGRKDLATEASRMIGQNVMIQGVIEQNGEWTNYKIDAIHPPGTATEHTSDTFRPPQQAPVQPQTIPQAPPSPGPPPVITRGPTENDMLIFRQCAAKVSARLSDDSQSFWTNCDLLVKYFATGEKPHVGTHASNGSDPIPQAQSEQFIPAGAVAPVPAHSGSFNDDDIPF